MYELDINSKHESTTKSVILNTAHLDEFHW